VWVNITDNRSPRIITNKMVLRLPRRFAPRNDIFVLTAADVSCLVIPNGCVGLSRLAALEQGIPVIAVRENRKFSMMYSSLVNREEDKTLGETQG